MTVPPKRPAPTFKGIIGSIRRIVDQESARKNVGPGLLLMIVVGLVIAAAAFVKTLFFS